MLNGPRSESCLLLTVHLSYTSRDKHSVQTGCRLCPSTSCLGCSGSVLIYKSVSYAAKNQPRETVVRKLEKQHQHCTSQKPIYHYHRSTLTMISLLVIREWGACFYFQYLVAVVLVNLKSVMQTYMLLRF